MFQGFLAECFRGLLYQNMGNCCERCFGKFDKRKYLRTRYNVERDFSIEFENLMDDEQQQDEMSNLLTPNERHLLSNQKYEDIIQAQRRIDVEIDTVLVRQEEELRQEEEAYYEAKREAARQAKIQKHRELAAKANANNTNAWVADDSEWEIAGGEDDFEMFLESVKARSLAARTRELASQVPLDSESVSSNQTRGERSHTEASSIDLEWEHEEGMTPMLHERSGSEEHLAQLAIKPMLKGDPSNGNTADLSELEWDNDFGGDDGSDETRSLLRGENRTEDEADR